MLNLTPVRGAPTQKRRARGPCRENALFRGGDPCGRPLPGMKAPKFYDYTTNIVSSALASSGAACLPDFARIVMIRSDSALADIGMVR